MSVKLSRSVVAGKVGQVVLGTVIVAAVLPLFAKARLVGKVTRNGDIGVGGVDASGKNACVGKIGAGSGEETGAAAVPSGGGIIGFGGAYAILRPVKAVVDPIAAELHAERI